MLQASRGADDAPEGASDASNGRDHALFYDPVGSWSSSLGDTQTATPRIESSTALLTRFPRAQRGTILANIETAETEEQKLVDDNEA